MKGYTLVIVKDMMCTSKEGGGLWFKILRNFNVAMLEKQG